MLEKMTMIICYIPNLSIRDSVRCKIYPLVQFVCNPSNLCQKIKSIIHGEGWVGLFMSSIECWLLSLARISEMGCPCLLLFGFEQEKLIQSHWSSFMPKLTICDVLDILMDWRYLRRCFVCIAREHFSKSKALSIQS